MRFVYCAFGILAVAAAVGCNGSKEPKAEQPVAQTQSGPSFKELKIEKLEGGKQGKYFKTPAPAEMGDRVWINYTGMLTDGTVFDSTVGDDKHPFSFEMKPGEVIDGMLEGIKGMPVGAKWKLEIPAKLAYGEVSPTAEIPPNSDLVFTISLVDIVKKGEDEVFDSKDLKIGTGPEAKAGSIITIHYEGRTEDQTLFDSSARRRKPLTVTLGEDEIQPDALDMGIRGMKVGGERIIRIPPKIGLPASERVPENSVQYFFVQLLEVK